jgi:dephospho-CoA kinase
VAWVIGLTGAVGVGKSSVLAWLAAAGAATLDADAVVHRLLAEDRSLIQAVARAFGPGLVGAAGVDRAALAARVFRDESALAVLEELVHPAVSREVDAWLAAQPEAEGLAVIEAIKLLEGGLASRLDAVWLVTCEAARRRERLLGRGWSAGEIERRMAAGPPLAARLARADVVIDNSGAWAATERQLGLAWARAITARRPA